MKYNKFAKITNKALELNKIIYFIMVFIVLFGAYTFESMTKSLMPQFEIPYITVITTMVGASSEDVEEMVTEVIEDSLTDIPNLEEVKSRSSKNVSNILLKFKGDSDKNLALQNVERKINKIKKELPEEADSPIISDVKPMNFPTILVNIPANQPYNRIEKIRDDIKLILSRIDGVKTIETFGLNKPRVTIYPNFDEMKKYKISSSMLIQLLKDKNLNIPLGEKELNNLSYSFETDNKIKSIQDLENVVLLSYMDRIVTLKDIAEIKLEDKDSKIKNYTVKDKKRVDVVNLGIFLKDDADSIKVNDECIRQVKLWNERNPNKQISLSLDTSVYIKTSIKDISTNAFSGILTVIIILFLFINLRESIVASLVIPITLISSIILFEPFGLSINTLSITGLIIALGMLVDNAIVVIEMIDENKIRLANSDFREVILFSINKVGSAIFSSTLTTICAFIPLAFLSGPVGSLIRSIPIAMALSVSLSFIVSITLTPVLAYSFLNNYDENKEVDIKIKILQIIILVICGLYAFSNNFELTILSYISGMVVGVLAFLKLFKKNNKHTYKKIFDSAISSIIYSRILQALVLIFTLAMFVYSLHLLGSDKIPKQNFPETDEPMMMINMSVVEGTSDKDIKKIFDEVEKVLGSKDYINIHSSLINGNRYQFFIELKDDREEHNKEIIKELGDELNAIPNLSTNINPNNMESEPIVIRLTGDDFNAIIAESHKVLKVLENVPGVINPKADYEYGNPTVRIKIDKEKASKNNLSIAQLSMELRHIIAGMELNEIKIDGENTECFIKYDDLVRNIDDIKNISVMNRNNQLVPIYDFVELEEYRSIKTLTHIDGKKVLEIRAMNDENATVPEIIKTFKKNLEDKGGLENGVSYNIAGEFDEMGKSYRDLAVKFIVALVLVYVVLLIQFNSFSQPLVIILCIPFSMIGVSLGYFFMGMTFSTLSFLGIISLVGIAINDAIVLMDFINQLRKEGYSKKDSIIEAANSRLKPIITTSLTTITGVLPLSIYNPNYSQMAYALIFGLLSSTVLTLIVIPTVLNTFEGFGRLFRRKDYQIEK